MRLDDPESLPKVSVVLPTYNRAKVLGRSIQSVLRQSYGNLELLVIDDGSDDETAEIVSAISDPRLRYISLSENTGVSAARNAGIGLARGEFIAFQDSDDEWLPNKLAKQVSAIEEKPDVAVVFCTLKRIYEQEGESHLNPRIPVPTARDALLRQLLIRNLAWTQTWLVRKSVLEEYTSQQGPFHPELSRGEDWELILRIAVDHKLMHLPEVLVLAYKTQGSLLAGDKALGQTFRVMLERHPALFQKFPDLHALYCRRLASLAMEYESAALARQWVFRALHSQPAQPVNYLALMTSLLGKRIYSILRDTWSRSKKALLS